MTELEKYDQIWNGQFQKTKNIKSKYFPYTERGWMNKAKYENILFSIWANHHDWDEIDGFEIKCRYKSEEQRTIYRVRELAEDAGLLLKVGNYYAGDHTNYYKKNHVLFDLIFRGADNQFGKWLEESDKNVDLDIIYKIKIGEFNLLSKDNNFNIFSPNVVTNLRAKRKRKKTYVYSLDSLKKLTKTMLPHYYNLMTELNNSVINDKLKLVTFIGLDENDEPRGRPYSKFCSTLNPNKEHKGTDGVLRTDFLKNIGIPDYYEIYDIKAQIPRVNWLFNTGEWKDDSYDFYSEIINDVDRFSEYGWKISRGKAGSINYNDSMKQLFMRIYFGKGTDEQSFLGYENEKRRRILQINNAKCWLDAKQLPRKERISTMKTFQCVRCIFGKNCPEISNCTAFYELDKWETEKQSNEDMNIYFWRYLCNSTKKICGQHFIKDLVFWYSFFIETEVKIELLKRGKKVYNVYDGFYFNSDISGEIGLLLKEKAEHVYINYMKPLRPWM